ncbi:MAG TPA: fibronectin type III domain-containing protein [Acidimicrobiales bacterium]|jgi:Fibronectin type III domain|nr:fibronectin type III domain-containing protein [Acidimicrobiales bacterium]
MRRIVPVVGLLALVPGLYVAGASDAQTAPVRLEEAKLIIEVNATDGDAGLQVFLDGEAWRSMEVFGPDGRKLLDVESRGELGDLGLTELFSESNEPSFEELSLEEFKALFPEGRYSFSGETVEGQRLRGTARLSHATPAGPMVVTPEPGGVVAPDHAVISWQPGDQPAGVEIVSYQVIVERENPLRVFSVDLPATTTSVTVPPEFLEPGTQYKLEVLAIEASGNQTITEIEFMTT